MLFYLLTDTPNGYSDVLCHGKGAEELLREAFGVKTAKGSGLGGLPKDPSKAREWYQRAADKGDPEDAVYTTAPNSYPE